MAKKRCFFNIVASVGMLLLAGGCSDDDYEPVAGPPVDDPKMPVDVARSTITARVASLTRTQMEGDDLVWAEGDNFGLYYVPGQGEATVSNRPYYLRTGSEGGHEGVFDSRDTLEWAASGGHKFYAVYPYDPEGGGNINAVKLNVHTLQLQSEADAYFGRYDFMVARAEYGAATDDVQLDFTYPLAVVDVIINAAGTEIASEQADTFIIRGSKPFAGPLTYDLETGAVSEPTESEVTVEYRTMQPFKETVRARLHLNPVDLTGDGLEIVLNTDVFEITIDAPVTQAFEAGREYEVTVDVPALVNAGKVNIAFSGDVAETSNCYMVAPGTTLAIPVERAYDLWQQRFGEQLQGAMSAELLWQDVPGLVTGVMLVDAAQGRGAKIVARTNLSNNQGNAVVVLKVGGKIRWSWHLWLTDYDPENELNGAVYFFNNDTDGGNYYFMDRNLGAHTTDKTSIMSRGYLYQWGRKDPFPGCNVKVLDIAWNETSNDSWPLYDIDNNEMLEGSLDGGAVIKNYEVPDNVANTLQLSIENPSWFYYGENNWYCADSANRDDYLWNGADGSKTVFDPCPQGWRIPYKKGGESPWNKAEGMETTPGQAGEGKFIFRPYEAGYYPFAGARRNTNASFMTTGKFGYYWSAEFESASGASVEALYMGVSANTWITNYGMNAGLGHSVRCMKDI